MIKSRVRTASLARVGRGFVTAVGGEHVESDAAPSETVHSTAWRRSSRVGRWPGSGAALSLVLAAALALPFMLVSEPVRAQVTAPTEAATPSEADRAALRYFASQGEYDRLEAEMRRLQSLYPTWQPPSDLLSPEGADAELQRIYDLVGQQKYDEARNLLAQRQQRDPSFQVPARLTELLETAEARQQLREASDRGDEAAVLRIAEANERILTCEDVDSIWRVAKAFAATGRPQRAYDAYAYVLQACLGQDAERAATLEKAAETLDTQYVTELFSLGRSDANGNSEFQSAELSILRGAVARGGADDNVTVPQDWLDRLADHAGTGANLDDAMLVGFYLYRHGNPAAAAQWFRFALDRGHGAPAAEAYIVALRATGNRQDEFLAREVAYEWREQSPELMEAYLDAMATVLTADASGDTSIDDVEQVSVDRYAPVVIAQRDPIGAQALGWYAYNTCQFVIAEEWFLTSANWVPTEAALFGLALTRQRLGDKAGFREVVDEWGPLYPSVAGLVTGEGADPTNPVARARDDRSDEQGVSQVVCDPRTERAHHRFLQARMAQRDDPIVYTEAGSLTALSARGAAPARDFVIAPRDVQPRLYQAQATTPLSPAQSVPRPPASPAPMPTGPLSSPPLPPGATLSPGQATPTALSRSPSRFDTGTVPATRQVLAGPTTPQRDTVTDRRVREIVSRPRTTPARSAGGGSVQSALARRDYGRCVAASDAAIRSGRISAADATARGYCLLELKRPAEAQHAFTVAQLRAPYRSAAASEAAYGASIVALVRQEANEAAVAAASAPMRRGRRTELQTQILVQQALRANSLGQTSAVAHFLEQRNKIAPLQKDLMLLQAYAYQNANQTEAADRMFRALELTGMSKEVQRGVYEANIRRHPLAGGAGSSSSQGR